MSRSLLSDSGACSLSISVASLLRAFASRSELALASASVLAGVGCGAALFERWQVASAFWRYSDFESFFSLVPQATNATATASTSSGGASLRIHAGRTRLEPRQTP